LLRLIPESSGDRSEITVAELVGSYFPSEQADPDRPFVAANMITTIDGRAAIEGRAKLLGGETDVELLLGLRTRFDALLVGAQTVRAERYGPIVRDPVARREREQRGQEASPLAAVMSRSAELPYDCELFTSGEGRVIIFTEQGRTVPETATPVDVVSDLDLDDLRAVLDRLAGEYGVRSVLCEGGPSLLSQLIDVDLVDEFFLTISPVATGEDRAPRVLEGELGRVIEFDLTELAVDRGELFARYRPRR
jgi:riboflavin biosynthesis pyrimidine reductase